MANREVDPGFAPVSGSSMEDPVFRCSSNSITRMPTAAGSTVGRAA